MTGHTTFRNLDRQVLSTGTKYEMIQYVNGYVLALEDVAGDIEKLMVTAEHEDGSVSLNSERFQALAEIRDHVMDSLDQAKETQESLREW